MTFGNLSLWLWLLAALASAFMLLSAFSTLSSLWHLPERMPKMKGSIRLRHGESELLKPLPAKSTAIQIAKMMILAGGLVLAYDAGQRTSDAKKALYLHQWENQYSAWQSRSAAYQKDYATWLAKQHKGE